MSRFFEETMQGLFEAVAIESGEIPLVKKENLPAPTFIAADMEKKLIDEVAQIRKEQKMSQSKLAELTGNKQQAISRTENKEHSPSLKMFYSMVYALGYELQIVKRSV